MSEHDEICDCPECATTKVHLHLDISAPAIAALIERVVGEERRRDGSTITRISNL